MKEFFKFVWPVILVFIILPVAFGLMLTGCDGPRWSNGGESQLGSLYYLQDPETSKCFAVLVRGQGIAMSQCDCDEVPHGLLLEAERVERSAK